MVDFLVDWFTFPPQIELNLSPDEDPNAWIPVDVSFIKEFWLPDAEILNLKVTATLFVAIYLLVNICAVFRNSKPSMSCQSWKVFG